MTNQVAVAASSLYDQFSQLSVPAEAQPWRLDAFNAFKSNGFPAAKDEYWRFLNIKPFLNKDYQIVLGKEILSDVEVKGLVSEGEIPGLEAYKLILVNGAFRYDLSFLPFDESITIQPLASVVNTDFFAEKINNRLDINTPTNGFAALNTALFTDGFFIEVKAGASIDKPIHIFNIYSAESNTFIQPRNMVLVNKSAAVEIIETYTCKETQAYFINSFSDLIVEENASLVHSVFQNGETSEYVLNHTQVTQKRDSRYENYIYSIPNSAMIRNNLNVELEGSNTETHMYGLYLAGKNQVIDNHSLVDHLYPNCNSNQLYKGVMLDGGKAVFNGRIYVHEDAQKTNAYQSNSNMLFSDESSVFSKPQLEIYADDVKCSHGTTIGQYDGEALFYLQSRGLSESQARAMLVNAFANDVTSKIPNEALRDFIEDKVNTTIMNAHIAI